MFKKDPGNFHAYVSLNERQSNNRAEQHAVLYALLRRAPSQKLCVILDAKMVYKGVVEWFFKWRRQGWKGSSGPVGHSDLWQQIHSLVIMHGDTLQLVWVPSHVNIEGNVQADKLAENGRLMHPHNGSQQPKRRSLVEGKYLGHSLGLVEMLSETESQQSDLTSALTSSPRYTPNRDTQLAR
mmetsp:Transcript_127777/g.220866  ORF Transcript_127777/g.220866 Transcript_127777/m.220866 type:complete len:182 (+) Transcript_127777:534-1079(+)